ncbi:very long chain fatty acid elongase 4-like [Choristoneura fumiferana]|uniref:very long chain fatty acid elongase 4-like n=1 Tax=Choristoneura fumiferana TaxID=7141 RepID=UPI003D15EF0F
MTTHILNSTQSVIQEYYDYYLWTLSLSDGRTKGWPLVDSPLPTVVYTALYLFIVWLGPKLMKNRQPFQLTWLLVPYNLAMAGLNAFIAVRLLTASFRLRYSYICEPCRQKYDSDELQIADAVWWYYFSKLLEFCDTFFFILRKKDEQLTFLHVYHHSTMFSFWWIGIKWVPSGSTFLPAMVNSAIHVLMYTYYGLSVFGPSVSKYLWWKKYLTILQLIQFTCALVLGINGIRMGCEFPLWMHYVLIFYMISFIVLFGNFYMKAYLAKGSKCMEVRYGQCLDDEKTIANKKLKGN